MTEFERLYEEHFEAVFRYLCRLSGDEHVAEDLTSATFLRAVRGLNDFRGDCDARVWLCHIAKNRYYSYAKWARRILPEDSVAETVADDAPTPDVAAATADEARRVRRCLHALPETYKEVFMWRVYAELSFRQIGEMFGKTENWACVTYHRACSMIRREMKL